MTRQTTTAPTSPFILCDNLVKIYQVAELEVVALQGLDLTVWKSEILGIVGASGSGKSTFLNILGGLDRPSAGRVMANGQDLLRLSDAALDHYRRTQVGFVWQQPARNLIPYLTVQENIELPMIVAGLKGREKRVWIEELLEMVELMPRRRHQLAQLSGGEQQRVAIAVALANKPLLLLADEPTGELDSISARSIFDAFRRFKAIYGVTVIIVTHDPQIVAQVDRVVAIRDGRTSTETVRRVVDLEQAMKGERKAGEDAPEKEDKKKAAGIDNDVSYEEYVILDSAGRLQIPREYLDRLGIERRATIELADHSIVIRPITNNEGDLSDEIKELQV